MSYFLAKLREYAALNVFKKNPNPSYKMIPVRGGLISINYLQKALESNFFTLVIFTFSVKKNLILL